MRPRTRALLERLCHLYPCVVIWGAAATTWSAGFEGLPVRRIVGNHGLEPGDHLPRFEREMAEIRPQLEASRAARRGRHRGQALLWLSTTADRGARRTRAALLTTPSARLALPVRAIPEARDQRGPRHRAPQGGRPDPPARAGGGRHCHLRRGRRDRRGCLPALLARPAALRSHRELQIVRRALLPAGSARDGCAPRAAREGARGRGAAPPGVEARSDMTAGAAGELMRGLWRLNDALEQVSRRMEATSGVTAQQRMMLRWIAKYPGMTASQLAAQFHLDGGRSPARSRASKGRGCSSAGATTAITAALHGPHRGRPGDRSRRQRLGRPRARDARRDAELRRSGAHERRPADPRGSARRRGPPRREGEGESDGASSDIRGR